MKKGIVGIILVALLVFSMGTIAMAGIDLEGEMNYEVGEQIVDGYTQIAITLAPAPFDFKLTWRRDWVPTLRDSVVLDTGVSMGFLRLGYTRELLEPDVGIGSLKLTNDPLTVEYTRILNGLDSGTVQIDLALTPFTFTYTKLIGDGLGGTVFVRFEKSF